MELAFNRPETNDLDRIIEIENSGFTPEEAATPSAMLERIRLIGDSFIVARGNDDILGYIAGPTTKYRYIRDELFDTTVPNEEDDTYQTVLALVVAPRYRGMGISGQLLDKLKENSRQKNLNAITLTCLENLIPYYEKSGFINEGVSDSKHAGLTWYNMVYEL